MRAKKFFISQRKINYKSCVDAEQKLMTYLTIFEWKLNQKMMCNFSHVINE